MGELPFKYLGVPLASKKLNFSQCKVLVDKITDRAQGWIAKTLSYAGRLQLVRSILSSMRNYWAQLFTLPKKLIRAVEGVCRKFLWTGKTLDSKKAPVAWATFYNPRADKLWVQWVNEYYMRRSDVYSVAISNSMSWQLKKILTSRELLQELGGWNSVMHNGKYSIKKSYKLLMGSFEKIGLANGTYHVLSFVNCVMLKMKPFNHLFFKCDYAAAVWQAIHSKLHWDYHFQSFGEEVRKAKTKARGQSRHARLYVKLFTEAIYAIWLQRNNKVFNDTLVPAHVLVKEIVFRTACNCPENERTLSLHDMRSSEDILWVRLEGLAFLFTQPKVAKKAFMQIGRVIFFDDITRSQDQPTCLRACVRVNLDRTLIPGFFI
ncbi:uncharacterized protein LOC109136466 [Beta vulgaris subsp. vulgaris]|uniref:uncharacterized protein LOC109136466 n=1 Tax=Beta vulgaris subsp. vulgaris TaxID=3555 RepID=UPI002036D032|nr:uncharacterized protein LOC109136466 [Beta vulgaris subsp. vulgaris]